MVNILKKIRVFFLSIFFSFKKIDNLLVNSNKEADNKIDGSLSIEQESESKSVYDDLLRGEVTERVRELRHEMYYSERKSKEYLYIGNGLVIHGSNERDGIKISNAYYRSPIKIGRVIND